MNKREDIPTNQPTQQLRNRTRRDALIGDVFLTGRQGGFPECPVDESRAGC